MGESRAPLGHRLPRRAVEAGGQAPPQLEHLVCMERESGVEVVEGLAPRLTVGQLVAQRDAWHSGGRIGISWKGTTKDVARPLRAHDETTLGSQFISAALKASGSSSCGKWPVSRSMRSYVPRT